MAPVGGTMWAASPARNIRPNRIGSATKLRSGAMLFSIDGPVTRLSAAFWSSRRFNSSQNLLVRPVASTIVVERALHVIAAARGRAHGAEREAARVVGIDQLVADRRRIRQDAEPAERIDPLEGLDRRRPDRSARLTP